MVMVMAFVYTFLGDYDNALDEFETLLSVPSYFSTHWLRADPLLAPLRDHPRFQQLLEKYGGNEEP